ncbi:putative disease resistance RPP13-like protein 1 [Bienertia sinuspersici]
MHVLIHDLDVSAAGDIYYVIGTNDVTHVNWERTCHVYLTRYVTTLSTPHGFSIAKFLLQRQILSGSCKLGYHSKILLHMHTTPSLKHNQNCCILEKVPNNRSLGKLHNLDIFGTAFVEMPMGNDKLTSLQHLKEFFMVLVTGHGSRVKLTISGIENVSKVEGTKEAELHKKYGVNKLYLEWGTCKHEIDDKTESAVLQQLKPHTSIEVCKLNGYKGLAFPSWLGDPCFINMVDVSLIKCEKCECLPPLGQLLRLKNLLITGMHGIKLVGPEFYGDLRCTNLFPALKSLHFEDMKSW